MKETQSREDTLYGYRDLMLYNVGFVPLSISYYFESNFSIESYASAILQILNISRIGYYEIFGYQGLIPISIHVHLDKNTSLTKPFLRVMNQNIYLTVSSDDDLLSSETGKWVINHVFGFAHELGHIVFTTDDPDFNEGWANYAAAYQIVPYVYNVLGDNAWPTPYNYSEREGRSFFLSLVNNESLCTKGSRYAAMKILYTLDIDYGPNLIGRAISTMKNEYADEIFSGVNPRLRYFADALAQLTGNYSIPDMFTENGFTV